MSINTYAVTTPAIASNTATIDTLPVSGLVLGMRFKVNTSAGVASVATCTITVTEVDGMGRTLMTATTVTGYSLWYNPQDEIDTTAGVGTGLYSPFAVTGAIRITVTSGTDTNYVQAFIRVVT